MRLPWNQNAYQKPFILEGWTTSRFHYPHWETGAPVNIRYGFVTDQGTRANKYIGTAVIGTGFDRPQECYMHMAKWLISLGLRPVFMEFYGQGGSDWQTHNGQKIPYNGPYDFHVEVLDHFIRHIVDVDTAARNLLIGHSRSGNIALQFLKKHPDNPFNGSLLVAPMLQLRQYIRESEGWCRWLDRRGFKTLPFSRWIGGAQNNYEPVPRDAKSELCIKDQWYRVHPALFSEKISPAATLRKLEECKKVMAPEYMPTIFSRIGIIEAEFDGLIDPAMFQTVKELLPNALFAFAEGVRHRCFYGTTEERKRMEAAATPLICRMLDINTPPRHAPKDHDGGATPIQAAA